MLVIDMKDLAAMKQFSPELRAERIKALAAKETPPRHWHQAKIERVTHHLLKRAP